MKANTSSLNASPATLGQFTKRDIGCVIDRSSGDADSLNEDTIELARENGFNSDGLLGGCFDGLRGLEIRMSLDDAQSASHSGQCDDDVAALLEDEGIAAQLDAIGADTIRDGLRESGGWDAEELSDDAQNRARAVWLAACDLKENASQMLSEMADEAVDYLNGLDGPAYCSWYFEDNSLFFMPCLENAREDVEFVSSREQDEPDTSFRGVWLHVSDHGNATLYVRGEGADNDGNMQVIDTEIWSLV